MCKSFGGRCNDCPADKNTCCDAFEWQEDLVTIVEGWAAAHPRKTRQSVFLEQWPEAMVDDNECVYICPADVSANYRDESGGCALVGVLCPYCRRKFWTQEVE